MALNVVSSDRLSTNVKTSNLATGLSSKVGESKNLVINGSCIVAQRSSSPVTDDSYRTVDRFALDYSGTDNHPTQAQHALTSSDTGPWAKGFKYSYHVTNGDQTSGAGAADEMNVDYRFEAQDIANSGWNYTSASSYITLSFWIKASVAQDYKFYLKTEDGTEKSYPMSTGALSADTWTKITKTIPGHADLTFDNNNAKGLSIEWFPFIGTDKTGTVTDNAWMTYSGSTRVNDMTSTWWTTNDSTFEITGLQLEVGDTATEFEHRSYGDELARCQRYFQLLGASQGTYDAMSTGSCGSATIAYVPYKLITTMRATPTFSLAGSASDFRYTRGGDQTPSNIALDQAGQNMVAVSVTISSATADNATRLFNVNTTGGLQFSAEL